MLRLDNKRFSICIDEHDGHICGFIDKYNNRDYITPSAAAGIPFRIEAGGSLSSAFIRFSYTVDESTNGVMRATLIWELQPGMTLTGTIIAASDTDEMQFYCEVKNDTEWTVAGVEYPIIPNLREISPGGMDDYIAHSFATGISIRNPMKHFQGEVAGLRHMPYPESFSGSSMQFFTYYGEGCGGVYFAIYDAECYAKWLNFYKNENDLLEASFYHGCEDMGARKGLNTAYPTVIRLLDGDGWYEAADWYKAWATQQFWCAKGELSGRDEKENARWLHEQMGAATFGINAGHDRSMWIDTYHRYIPTPMFHMLGPDWVNNRQTFGRGVPGGMDDWFPTRFSAGTLASLKKHGDKYAPFEFDYLYDMNGADGELGKQAAQKFPQQEHMKSMDKYHFPLICPAHPYTHDFHVRRDERLQEEVDVDSIYYDISANNIMKICMDDSHGHPVGAGRAITNAYRQNYIDTKEAMIRKAGRYIPMGTEMMCEVFLDVLDYYQSRAGGRPASPLELHNLKELVDSGTARLIPMFTYVYHEYGALRMDGWGKLVEEIGSLFYYTVARTYLWGGLYELNYEYSPMEALEGVENKSEEHYADFEARGYALSEERASYVGMYASLRTGPANKYLAYGRMLKPLKIAIDQERIMLDWYHYNHAIHSPEYNTSGSYEVETVVHSAWQYKNESAALFFANVTGEDRIVLFSFDSRSIGLPGKAYRLRKVLGSHSEELAKLQYEETQQVKLAVPAKRVVWLEVYSE